MNRLKQQWSDLRATFWFLPFLMVLTSIVYAVVLIQTDYAGSDRWLAQWPRIFGVGAEGARDMLSTLAGSMMSVMGITFSMTLLALALAGAALLVMVASRDGDTRRIVSFSIYGATLFLLYLTSTLYHGLPPGSGCFGFSITRQSIC